MLQMQSKYILNTLSANGGCRVSPETLPEHFLAFGNIARICFRLICTKIDNKCTKLIPTIRPTIRQNNIPKLYQKLYTNYTKTFTKLIYKNIPKHIPNM